MNPFTQIKTKPKAIFNSCRHVPLLLLTHCLKSVEQKCLLLHRKMSACHRTLLCSPKYWSWSTYCRMIVHFLSGYAKYFTKNSKLFRCEVMFENEWTNTRSSREYTTFVLAQLLRIWRKQRPVNQYDLDSWRHSAIMDFFTVVRNFCWVAF